MVDLRGLPGAEREAAACQLAADAARQPFDLGQCPPLRAVVARLDETDYRMYLTLHDMVCDCYSLYHVLLSELRALYETFSAGQPASLPGLPIQYSDYACWQQEWLQGERLTDSLAYWEQQLSGVAESVALPTDYRPPLARSYQGGLHRFALSRQLADALIAASRQHKVTLHMTLLAAFKAMLACYSGQSDLLVGASSSGGRMRSETQALAGVFANTLLMRTSLAGNPSLYEVLERVREVSIEAYTHQQVPYQLVARSVWPGSDLSQHPLFRAQFMLEPSPPVLPSRWTATQMEIETGAAKTDLSLALCDRPEGLVGRFEYRSDMFAAETIAQMAEHLKLVLESIVTEPDQRLAELRWRINGRRHPVNADAMSAGTMSTATKSDLSAMGTDRAPSLARDADVRVADGIPAASASAIQHQLIQIWEALLGMRPVGVTENFFDLGGDSLLAARLVQCMAQVWGKEISLATLFDGATIEYLTRVLLEEPQNVEANQKVSGPAVVTVQAGGAKRPFFFLHGDWRLEAFWCRRLARDLGPEQPFYALPPYKFQSDEAPPTFSDMAAAHVQAMRTVQPEGPYALGGFCNGGMVAYEMAQQLLAAGEVVSLLALVNPYVAPARHRWLARLINRAGALLGLSEVQRLEWFLRIHLTYQHARQLRQQGVPGILRKSSDNNTPDQEASAPHSFRALFPTAEEIRDDWSGRYSWMTADYLPHPYPGKVTVFWSSEEPIDEPGALSVREQRALWQRLVQATETETYLLPGTRSSCRSAHLSELAAQLRACL